MFDVGILGLDTSHPEPFAGLLEDHPNARLTAVWDGGDVRSTEYVATFCEDWDATRYDDPAAMVDAVDGAMVLTVNWDTHLPLARPFLEAGIPTLIDKPLVGTPAEVSTLAALTSSDVPLFGGSAVPFHPDVNRLPTAIPDRSVFAAGYNDYFYYRVHLIDAVRSLAGTDWTSVTPTAEPGTTVRIQFADGTHATLRFDGATNDSAFGLLDVADRTRTAEIPATEDALAGMYASFINAFYNVLAGDRDDTERVLDGARLALAVESALDDGEPVTADAELPATNRDGATFLDDYEPYY